MKKIHLFYDPTLLIFGTEHMIQSETLYKQITRVLKLHEGEYLICTNGTGLGVKYKIKKITSKTIELQSGMELEDKNTHKKILLACAISKRDSFEYIVEKATELGVSEIIPIISTRTIKSQLKKERLERIAIEAMEQSEQFLKPTIREPISFDLFLKEVGNIPTEKYTKIIFDPSGEGEYRDKKTIRSKIGAVLSIGPEGGWTEEELISAEKGGFSKVTLGNTILKTDTAAIVAMFWIQQTK